MKSLIRKATEMLYVKNHWLQEAKKKHVGSLEEARTELEHWFSVVGVESGQKVKHKINKRTFYNINPQYKQYDFKLEVQNTPEGIKVKIINWDGEANLVKGMAYSNK